MTVVVDRGGQLITLTPTLIDNQVEDAANPGQTVQASFLGVGLVGVYARQSLGAVFVQIGDIVGRTGEALVQLPSRVPGLFGSVFLGEQRDQNGPVGIVGASRIGGQILALDAPAAAELSFFLQLLAAVNISLFLFNLLPIPPLDGGQIFPAHLGGHQEAGRAAARAPRPRPGGRGQAHAGGLRGGAGVHRLERAAVRRRHRQPGRAALQPSSGVSPHRARPRAILEVVSVSLGMPAPPAAPLAARAARPGSCTSGRSASARSTRSPCSR